MYIRLVVWEYLRIRPYWEANWLLKIGVTERLYIFDIFTYFVRFSENLACFSFNNCFEIRPFSLYYRRFLIIKKLRIWFVFVLWKIRSRLEFNVISGQSKPGKSVNQTTLQGSRHTIRVIRNTLNGNRYRKDLVDVR